MDKKEQSTKIHQLNNLDDNMACVINFDQASSPTRNSFKLSVGNKKESIQFARQVFRNKLPIPNDFETFFFPNSSFAFQTVYTHIYREVHNNNLPITTYCWNRNHTSNFFPLKNPTLISKFPLNPKKPSLFSLVMQNNIDGSLITHISVDGHYCVLDYTQWSQHKPIKFFNNKNTYFYVFSSNKALGPHGISAVITNDQKFFIDVENRDDWELDWSALSNWAHWINNNWSDSYWARIHQKEKKLTNYFTNHFPYEKFQLIITNPESTIFLLKTDAGLAHGLCSFLECNNIITRSGMCCSIPFHNLSPHEILRISLNHTNTISEIKYLFKLLCEFDPSSHF